MYASMALLTSAARCGTAISPEAEAVERAREDAAQTAEYSDALFGAKRQALSDLAAMLREDFEDKWDMATVRAAAHVTEAFIRALPNDAPLPEFVFDPDGAISVDWIESRHRLLSLRIGDSHRLAYAWVDGTNRGQGVEHFDGEVIPQRLLSRIYDTMCDA